MKFRNDISNSQELSGSSLVFLDGLRGLAAIYVMVGHARSLLWEGYSLGFVLHPQNYNIVNTFLVYFLGMFRFGTEAVFLFFVLSGFVIHLKYARQYKSSSSVKFGYWNFIFRRVKRIYPPFVFALLLTYILSKLGNQFGFLDPSLDVNLQGGATLTNYLDFKTLWHNLLFLYYTYSPIFGYNGPSWSLKFEWWFYMIYPALMIFSNKTIYLSTVCVVGLFIFSFFPAFWPEHLSREIFSFMICWWTGVLLAEVYTGRIALQMKYLVGLLLCFPLVLFIRPMDFQIYYLFISLGFCGLLAVLFLLNQTNNIHKCLKVLQPLGLFSYTLYIIHYPIFIFIRGWWQASNSNEVPEHFGLVFSAITLVLILSYLFHWFTEVPFLSRRRIIQPVVI